MSDLPNDSPPAPGPAAAAAAAAAAGSDAAAVEPQAAPEPAFDAGKIIAGLQDEIDALNDRLLRTHAEMDNMRKRAERDKADTAKYAITRFATDIVTVGDNLSRALSSATAGTGELDPALTALIEGVTMTDRALVATLERHGVKRVDPQGEIFNPHLHQAIAQITDASVAAGTIVQVHQSGYTIEDRVLRPAMVVVAQGGFKPMKPPAGEVKPGAAASVPEGG